MKISVSLLSADFSCLGEDMKAMDRAGVDAFHFDIMDGHFVPNLTFGPSFVRSLRPHTSLPFDVHLMVDNPSSYVDAFAEAGANALTVHWEAETHLHRCLSSIKDHGLEAGVAFNPSTPLEGLEYCLDVVDRVLVMSVNPGFGGQSFLSGQVEKIKRLKDMLRHHPIEIAVDGGLSPETAPLVAQAGAHILVAGSACFKGPSEGYKARVNALRRAGDVNKEN